MKEKTKKALLYAGGIGLGVGTVLLGFKYKKLTNEIISLKQNIGDLREFVDDLDNDIFTTIGDILSIDFVAEAIDAAAIARNHDMGGM